MEKAYLLVNFGGPRHLNEIEEFLISLLTDQEVLRTPFPPFLHRLLFTRIAKKRSKMVCHDYSLIGGKSPIFEDTEAIAENVGRKLGSKVITFHRYLPQTHPEFIKKMKSLQGISEIRVFPMFPQFSYATTGSIALWFANHLPHSVLQKLSWIKSYPCHPLYIDIFEHVLREFLEEKKLKEEETILLFSAHGLPQKFIDTGDIYQEECQQSFDLLRFRFPRAVSHLSYQSQFGKEEWIRPYTAEVCEQANVWGNEKKNVVVVPLSFTSDHIETLFEIEELYLPVIRRAGFDAYRCPALNRRDKWIESIALIFKEEEGWENPMLVRKKAKLRIFFGN